MTDRAPSILVITGHGQHADPWHALQGTSEEIAAVLTAVGEARVTTTAACASWDADLFVVNASGDLARAAPQSGDIVDALEAHHRAGKPVLAMHTAAIAFRDDPRWKSILGGHWAPGRTMHPQIGWSLVQPVIEGTGSEHPIASAFRVYDERYSYLEVADSSVVLSLHTEDGIAHPLMWERPATSEHGAVVYDALGHGVESFASTEHRRWLVRTARDLLFTAREGAPL